MRIASELRTGADQDSKNRAHVIALMPVEQRNERAGVQQETTGHVTLAGGSTT